MGRHSAAAPNIVFDEYHRSETVPVTVEIEGEKRTIGEATLYDTGTLVHVSMWLRTENPGDVFEMFSSGITAVSLTPNDFHVEYQEEIKEEIDDVQSGPISIFDLLREG